MKIANKLNFSMFKWIFGGSEPENQIPLINRQQMKLTPLSSFSVPFISINSWDSIDNNIKKNIYYIQKKITMFEQKLEYHNKYPPKTIPFPVQIKNQSQRMFAINVFIYNRHIGKAYEYQKSLYNEGIVYSKEMEVFANNVIANSYPVAIDINGFLNELTIYVTNNPKYQKLVSQSQILEKKCVAPPNVVPPTTKQLNDNLSSIAKEFDTYSIYIEESGFDTVFADYVEAFNKQHFDEMLNYLSYFEYEKALSKLKDYSFSLGDSLKIPEDDFARNNILLFTAARYLFARVAIEYPYILSNDLSTKSFLKTCEYIQTLTPKCLKAVKYIFKPSQYEKSVIAVFSDDKYLRESLSCIGLIQFHYCAIDIANLAVKAISYLKQFIIINTYINKKCKGDENCALPDEISGDGMIAFDELFAVFYMAIACNPPANSIAIGVFLKAFGNFEHNGSLDYASTSLQAAISFICEFKKEETGP